MSTTENGYEELRVKLSQQGVKLLLASYVDMHGVPKSKMVPIDHLAQMARGSELFTGAALDGVPQDVSDEEVSSHPDLESCRVLPWNPDNNNPNTLRIPLAGGRVELRAADPACNPYLGAAMVLTAGLEGIDKQRDPHARTGYR